MMKAGHIIRLFAGTICIAIVSCNTGDNNTTVNPNGTGNNTTTPNTTSEQKLLNLVNDVRSKGCNCGSEYFPPVGAISWNDQLETAAAGHSAYMNRVNELTHTGENGSSAGDRITAAGYTWRTYGENVAVGYTTEEEVIQGWINSPGHCKNIMNGNFVHMGVARESNYWTQEFAAPR